MKTVYVCLIILLLLSPGVETRKLSKLSKRKMTKGNISFESYQSILFFITVVLTGIAFVVPMITNSCNSCTNDLMSRDANKELSKLANQAESLIKKELKKCEETSDDKKSIICKQHALTTNISNTFKGSPILELPELKALFNELENQIVKLSEHGQSSYDLMPDNQTKLLFQKLKPLVEIVQDKVKIMQHHNSKRDESRPFLLLLMQGIKSCFSCCFSCCTKKTTESKCNLGIAKRSCFDKFSSVSKYFIELLSQSLALAFFVVEYFEMNPTNNEEFNHLVNDLKTHLLIPTNIMLLLSITSNFAALTKYKKPSTHHLDHGITQDHLNSLKVQINSFKAVFNQVSNLRRLNRLEMEAYDNSYNAQDMHEINSWAEDSNLYFADIYYTYEEDNLLSFSNKGFEIISSFDGKTKDNGNVSLYVLGKRRQAANVIVFLSFLRYYEVDGNNSEIDYNLTIDNKLEEKVNDEMVRYFVDNCETNASIISLQSFLAKTKKRLELTKLRYIVIVSIEREIYNHPDNGEYVNCFEKYMKPNENNRQAKDSFKSKAQEAITDPSKLYNKKNKKIKNQLKNFTFSPKKAGSTKLSYPKIQDYPSESDSIEFPEYNQIKKNLQRKALKDLFYRFETEVHDEIKKNTSDNKELINLELKGIPTQKQLMISSIIRSYSKLKNINISLNDCLQAYLNKKVEENKPVLIEESDNEMPFWKVFTGYFHNNQFCQQYDKLFHNAYKRPYLEQSKWNSGENISLALVYDQNTYEAKSIENMFKLSDLIKFTLKPGRDNEFVMSDLKEETEQALKSLTNCEYASLAVQVNFTSKKINNPKIEIYPYFKDIEVNLVEDEDHEQMFKKEVVVTFTLVDVNRESEEFKEFNMKDNAERRYFTMGYFKIQSNRNESDFKIYTEDGSKYILVNFWSKINIELISPADQENTGNLESKRELNFEEPQLEEEKNNYNASSGTNLQHQLEDEEKGNTKKKARLINQKKILKGTQHGYSQINNKKAFKLITNSHPNQVHPKHKSNNGWVDI